MTGYFSLFAITTILLTLTMPLSHAQETQSDPLSAPESGKRIVAPKDSSVQEITNLKASIIELQNKSKLGFNKIVTCKSVDAFGVYSPIEPSTPTNKLIFYVEPANFSTLQSADRYIIDCAVDLQILDIHGKPLLSTENASKINRISRSPILDLYFKIELNLKMEKKPAAMMVRIVLHDKIKNQSASANIRIKMEGGKPKQEEQI